MRFLLAAAAAILLCAGAPASAQGQASPVQNAVEVSPERTHAARQTLQTMMIDNGLLQELVLEAFRVHMPTYRQTVANAPFFAGLTPARRDAVLEYVGNLGPVLSEEVMRMSPVLLDRYAPRIAALFDEAELADIRAYMQSPGGASLFRRGALAGARGEVGPAEFTDEEMQAALQFATTAGGRAWEARAGEFNGVLHELGYQSVAQTAPTFQARVAADICALTEEQCPPEMRAAAQPS